MPLLQEPVAVSIEKILLATDFSIASEKAAAYAKAIALRFGSKLEIAHVFDPSVVTSYADATVTLPVADRKRVSDECMEEFAGRLSLGGIPTELTSIEDHRHAAALLDLAGEHRADLIVAGTEAKTGLSRLILGSTAEHLLRSANCPVLTVGPNARTPQEGPLVFRTIVYATDFSPEAIKASTVALSFAEDSNASLFCCCVLGIDDEGLRTREELHRTFTRRLKEMIPAGAYDWCNPEVIVAYGEAADQILKLAERTHADLIVLGSRKSSFWLTQMGGGLTPALLADAKCPVLTIC